MGILPCHTAEIDSFIATPTPNSIEALANVKGDVMVLGAGGKMGLHLSLALQEGFRRLGRDNPCDSGIALPEPAAAHRFREVPHRDPSVRLERGRGTGGTARLPQHILPGGDKIRHRLRPADAPADERVHAGTGGQKVQPFAPGSLFHRLRLLLCADKLGGRGRGKRTRPTRWAPMRAPAWAGRKHSSTPRANRAHPAPSCGSITRWNSATGYSWT